MHCAFFRYLGSQEVKSKDSTEIPLLGLRMPPVNKVPLLVKLSSLVVEPVRDLVTNHPTDRSVVHVLGSVAREEDSLEDASRELDRVLER